MPILKASKSSRSLSFSFALLLVLWGGIALAAPQGGRIESGAGDVTSDPLNIRQDSQELRTSWDSFNISSGEVVTIHQPNARALINIKVRNGSGTNIDGGLNANGKVQLENPAGITFGAGSVVNVGGLLASASAGAVVVKGEITATGAVRFQGLSSSQANAVNIGGAVTAKKLVIEGAGDVIVKATAVLTAPEIFVGGGFQGNNENIANALYTFVEKGAQLNAGERGRVIVWSDKRTWFYGDINAPRGGFVEVSGKEDLVYVNLAGIDVGTEGTLLLDPNNITLGGTSSGGAGLHFGGAVINRDEGGTSLNIVLSSDDINGVLGNLILQANKNIIITEAITKTSGDLTLDAGQNINFKSTSSASITLNGTDAILTLIVGQVEATSTGFIRGFSEPFNGGGGTYSITAPNLVVEFASQLNLGLGLGTNAFIGETEARIGQKLITLNISSSLTVRSTRNEAGTSATAANATVQVAAWMFIDGVDLTVEATRGSVNFAAVGSIGTGALDVSADGTLTGAILFPSTGTLTAASIALDQVAAYSTTAPGITFSPLPTLSVGGEAVLADAITWDALEPPPSGPTDITIDDGNKNDLFEDITAGFTITDGILDLGEFSLTISAAFTLPTSLTEIRAGTITISGAVTSESAGGLKLISTDMMMIDANITLQNSTGDLVIATAALFLADGAPAPVTLSSSGDIRVSSTGAVGVSSVNDVTIISTSTTTGTENNSIYLNGPFNLSGATLTLTANAGTVAASAAETGHSAATPTISADTLVINAGTLVLRNWMNTRRSAVTITIAAGGGGQLKIVEDYFTFADILTITAPQIVVAVDGTGADSVSVRADVLSITATATGAGATSAIRNTDNESLVLRAGLSDDLTINALNIDFAHSATGGDLTLQASNILLTNSSATAIKARDLVINSTTIKAAVGATKKNLTLEATNEIALDVTTGDITIDAADITLTSAEEIDARDDLIVTASGAINLNASVTGTNSGLTFTAGGAINFGGTADITIKTTIIGSNGGAISLTSPGKQSPAASVSVSINAERADISLSGHFALANDKTFKASTTSDSFFSFFDSGVIVFATGGTHSITASTITFDQADPYTQLSLPDWTFSPLPTALHEGSPVAAGMLDWDNLGAATPEDIVLSTGDGDLGDLIDGKFELSGDDGTTLDLGAHNLTITTSETLTIPDTITTITTTGTITLTSGAITLNAGLTLTAASITIGADLNAGAGDLTITGGSTNGTRGGIIFSKAVTLMGRNILFSTTGGGSVQSAGFDLTLTATVNLTLDGVALDLSNSDNSKIGNLALTYGGGSDGETPGSLVSPSSLVTDDLSITNDLMRGVLNYAAWMAPASGSNRNLTLSGYLVRSREDINLGTGDLTLNAIFIRFAGSSTLTITAGNITMAGYNTLDGVNSAIETQNSNLTLDASGDITITAIHIDFSALSSARNNLTLEADGSIFFRRDTTITDVSNLTLGGTIKAETADGSMKNNLTVQNGNIASNTITFVGVTTISGANISLASTNAQTDGGNPNVTITANVRAEVEAVSATNTVPAVRAVSAAAGDVILRGGFDIGTGDLVLTSGAGGTGGTGTIDLTDGATLAITAANITFNQPVGTTYPTSLTAGYTFTASGDIVANIGGAPSSADLDWVISRIALTPESIVIDSDNNTMTLADIIAGAFEVDGDGLLDLTTFSLTISAAFTLPADLTEIRADGITISAAVTSQSAGGLKLISAGDMTINANITLQNSTGDLVIAAETLTLASSAPVELSSSGDIRISSVTESTTASAHDVAITSTSTTAGTENNSVYLNGSFNFGSQALTLTANAGTIAASNAETGHSARTPAITANSLTINAGTLKLRSWMKPISRGVVTITISTGGQLKIVENYSIFGGTLTIDAPQIVVDVAGTGNDLILVSAKTLSITASATGAGAASAIRNTDNESLSLNDFESAGTLITIDALNIDFAHNLEENSRGGNLSLVANGSVLLTKNTTSSQAVKIKARYLTINSVTIKAAVGDTKKNLILEATDTLTFAFNAAFSPPAATVEGADITLTSAQTISTDRALTITADGSINLNAGINSTAGDVTLTAGSAGAINFGVASGASLVIRGAANVSLTSPAAQSPAALGNVEIRARSGNLNLSGNYAVAESFTISAGIGIEASGERSVVFATGGSHSITASSITINQSATYTQTELTNWTFSTRPTAQLNGNPVAASLLVWDNLIQLNPGNVELTGTDSGDLAELISDKFELEGTTLDLGAHNLTITTSGTLTIPNTITTITTTGTITLNAGTITLNNAFSLTAAGITIGADLNAGTGSVGINGGADGIVFSKAVTLMGRNIFFSTTDGGSVQTAGFDLTLTATVNLTLDGVALDLSNSDNSKIGNLALTYGGGSDGETPGSLVSPSSLVTDDLSITNDLMRGVLNYAAWMAPASGSNRNLTLSGYLVRSREDVNLGTGDFTLNAIFIEFAGNSTLTVTAGNITITGYSTLDGVSSAIENQNSNLTLDASGDITISAAHIDSSRESSATNNLTLEADGSIFFRRDTTFTDVFNLTIGGTIRAQSADGSTKYNLTVQNGNIAANTITFVGVTTISGANISLASTNAQADGGNPNVTITANVRAEVEAAPATNTMPAVRAVSAAAGDVILRGGFDIGTGDLVLTSGADTNSGGTGTIDLTDGATLAITAANITFNQPAGTTYPTSLTAGYTFTASGDIVANIGGAPSSADLDWVISRIALTPESIVIDSDNNTMTLADIIAGAFEIDDDGLLDLTTFSLTISAAFTLPADLTEIRARYIEISGAVTSESAGGLKLIGTEATRINANITLQNSTGDLVIAAERLTLARAALVMLSSSGDIRVSSGSYGNQSSYDVTIISTSTTAGTENNSVYLNGLFNLGSTLTLTANAGTILASNAETGHPVMPPDIICSGGGCALVINAGTLTLKSWMQIYDSGSPVKITIAANGGGQLTIVDDYNPQGSGPILTITAPQIVVDVAGTGADEVMVEVAVLSITASATGEGATSAIRNTDNESLILRAKRARTSLTIDALNIDFTHNAIVGNLTLQASNIRLTNSSATAIKATDLTINSTTIKAAVGEVKKNLTLEATNKIILDITTTGDITIDAADITLTSAEEIDVRDNLIVTASGSINLNASVTGTASSLTFTAGRAINFGGTADISIETTTIGGGTGGSISLTSPVAQSPAASVSVIISTEKGNVSLSGHFVLANNKVFNASTSSDLRFGFSEGVRDRGAIVFATEGRHSITAGSIAFDQSDEYTQTSLPNWTFSTLPTARHGGNPVAANLLDWQVLVLAPRNIVININNNTMTLDEIIAGKFRISGGVLNLTTFTFTINADFTLPDDLTEIRAGEITISENVTSAAAGGLKLISAATMEINANITLTGAGDLVIAAQRLTLASRVPVTLTAAGNVRVSSVQQGANIATKPVTIISTGNSVYLNGNFNLSKKFNSSGTTLTLTANAGTVAASAEGTGHAAATPQISGASALNINARTLVLKNWMQPRGNTGDSAATITITDGGQLKIVEDYIFNEIGDDTILTITAPQIVVDVAGTGADEITVAADILSITATATGEGATSAIRNTDNESLILMVNDDRFDTRINALLTINVLNVDFTHNLGESSVGGNLRLQAGQENLRGNIIFAKDTTSSQATKIKARDLTINSSNTKAVVGSTNKNLILEATNEIILRDFPFHGISDITIEGADITLISAQPVDARDGLIVTASGDINLNASVTSSDNLTFTAGSAGSINFLGIADITIRADAHILGYGNIFLTSPVAQSPAATANVTVNTSSVSNGGVSLSGHFALASDKTFKASIGDNNPFLDQFNADGKIIFATVGKHSITAGTIIFDQVERYTQTSLSNWTFSPLPTALRLGGEVPLRAADLDWDNLIQLNPANIELTGTDSGDLADLIDGKFELTGTTLNLGAHNLIINTSGTLTIPDTITTITTTGAIMLTAGAITLNAELTLTATSLEIGFDFGLTAHDLTLNGAMTFTANVVLTGSNITLNGAVGTGGNNLTLTSAGNLNLGGDVYTLGAGNLVLSATDDIVFSDDEGTTIRANNITLGGAVKAESIGEEFDPGTGIRAEVTTQHDLTLIASGQIIFATDKATTISGADITLTSPTAQTNASDKNLTITATGNLTLEGGFNIGNDATTGGIMRLTAGEGAGTGSITFTTATLTAKAMFLTQDGDAFLEDAPATFTLPSGVKPQVDYTGSAGTEYKSPSWAECASGASDCITILAVPDDGINVTQDDDINLADAVSPFDFSVDEAGLLDLGGVSLTLITKGNIIFPAGITRINASSLTLTAANIGTGADGTGSLTANLLIDIEGVLSLSIGTLTSTADLTIEAESITLAANTNIIKAANINLTGASEINYFESLFGETAGIQSRGGDLTLDATGDITISSTTISFVFLGSDFTQVAHDLTLKAGGATIFTKDTFASVNNITLGGRIKAESTDDSSGTEVTTQHNLALLAVVGQMNFTKATMITGADIAIGSAMDVTSSQDLTMTATETVRIGGNFNFGAGNLVLSATNDIVFSDDEGTTIQANNITLSGAVKSESTLTSTENHRDGTFTTTTTITQQNLTLTATGQIIFATDKATTISGADITLTSPTAQTRQSGEGQGLTITANTRAGVEAAPGVDEVTAAAGNIVLRGGFDIGTGDLVLTSGTDTDSGGAGTIDLTDGATLAITAASITFNQPTGTSYPTSLPEGYTFTASGDIVANIGGAPSSANLDWVTLTPEDITIDDASMTLADIIAGKFAISEGLLDLGTNALTISVAFTLPTDLTEIRAGTITISGAVTSASAGGLKLISAGAMTINANITLQNSTGDLVLAANALTLATDAPVTLSSSGDIRVSSVVPGMAATHDVTITSTSTTAGAENNSVYLNGYFNLGSQTLTLTANAGTIAASADETGHHGGTLNITASTLVINAGTLVLQGWMKPQGNTARAVTITIADGGQLTIVGNYSFLDSENNPAGTLTISAPQIVVDVADTEVSIYVSIIAQNISITATATGEGAASAIRNTDNETLVIGGIFCLVCGLVDPSGVVSLTIDALNIDFTHNLGESSERGNLTLRANDILFTKNTTSDQATKIKARDLIINTKLIDVAAGDTKKNLILEATNELDFYPITNEALTITGADITLISAQQVFVRSAVTITASGSINLNAGIASNAGDLTLTAGSSGSINFGGTANITISNSVGGISLTSPVAQSPAALGSVEIRANAGNLTLSGKYNVAGSFTASAGICRGTPCEGSVVFATGGTNAITASSITVNQSASYTQTDDLPHWTFSTRPTAQLNGNPVAASLLVWDDLGGTNIVINSDNNTMTLADIIAGAFEISGGVLDLTTFSLTISAAFTLPASLTEIRAGTITISGAVTSESAGGLRLISAGDMTINANVTLSGSTGDLVLAANALTLANVAPVTLSSSGDIRVSSVVSGTASAHAVTITSTSTTAGTENNSVYLNGSFNLGSQALTLTANAGTVAASAAETGHSAARPTISADTLVINARTLELRNWMRSDAAVTITIASGGQLTLVEGYSNSTRSLTINAPQVVVDVAGEGTDSISISVRGDILSITATAGGEGANSAIRNTDNESLILATNGANGTITIDALNVDFTHNLGESSLGGNLTLGFFLVEVSEDILFTKDTQGSAAVKIKARDIRMTGRTIKAAVGGIKRNLILEATGRLGFSHFRRTPITIEGADITLTSAQTISANRALTITATGSINLNASVNSTSGDLTLTAGTGGSINFGGTVDITIKNTEFDGGAISLTSPIAQNPPANINVTISSRAANIILSGHFALANTKAFSASAGGIGTIVFAETGPTTGATHHHSITAGAITFDQSGAYTQTTLPNWTFSSRPTAQLNGNPVAADLLDWDNLIPVVAANIELTGTDSGDLAELISDKFVLTGTTLDLGAHNLIINTDGTLTIPDTITTITTTGAITLTAGAVTLNAGLILTASTIAIGFDLGATAHSLTLNGAMTFNANVVLTGSNITLNGAVGTGGNNLTLTSAGNLNLGGDVYTLGAGNLVLSATDDIVFSDDEGMTIQANNITLSGVIKTESTDEESDGSTTITQQNLTLTATGQIIFATDKATTITGAVISLTSPTAQTTASDKNLTITAMGNLTLEGGFDIGNDATTGGTMTLTAGDGDSSSGIIIFTGTPTLTASAITLTQDGAVFPFDAPDVTFQIGALADGLPRIRYTGDETQEAVNDWAQQRGIFRGTNINLEDELDGGELDGENQNPDPTNKPNDIMIDLTQKETEEEKDFIINSEENFILPDGGAVMIKANVISITAKSIRTATGESLSQPLVLEASEMVMISADIDSSADIIIKAPQIIFSEEKPVRLKARNIMVELPDGMDMPDMSSDMFGGNNQNVELVASGDIMLNNNVNIGFGTLNLQARGRIMAPSRDVMIIANRIVYHPNTEENIGNFSIMLFARNDIHLMNNITANGNIVLRAGGSIVTPSAHTIIEAKGSSQDGDGNVRHHSIHFQQNYAFRQHHPLTLKAAGSVLVVGRLDRGNATITLDAGAAPADDTGRRGGLGIISPAFKAGRILCPNAKAPICQ